MASKLIDGIGLVSGAFGIIGFLKDNIPAEQPSGPTIQVKAGRVAEDLEMGGWVQATYAWDKSNGYLGQGAGGGLDAGGTVENTVDSVSPGVRGDLIGLSMSHNAVCVAWVSVKQEDGSDGGSWTGDIGADCGQHWYENGQLAGVKEEDGEEVDYYPRCTWFDGDHTNGIPSAAMKWRTRAYEEPNAEGVASAGRSCDYTRYSGDQGPISDSLPDDFDQLADKAERSANNAKAVNRPRQPWMEERLIMSNLTSHRAEDMCNSETSWGPDFISPDGMYCDMGTKTLAPLCSNKDVDGCVEVDEMEQTITKRSFVEKRAVDVAHKSFTNIKNWN